jgi:hypothetical protein
MAEKEIDGWPRVCGCCTWGHPDGWMISCQHAGEYLPREARACEHWKPLDHKRERD